MLLALDIGNTNVTLGVFEGDDLRATWRIATDASRMPDEYGLAISQLLAMREVSRGHIDSVVLCSVVPPLTPSFVILARNYFGVSPLVVGTGTRTGMRILYDNPRDVGADRIVDAAAALKLYGGPAIVVDIGTATVFDAVTERGEYIGGAISPGLRIAADSLFHSTSMLRSVELREPPAAIGRNTVHAMQSGLVLGFTDLVKGMVARFQRELGGGARVIATGGLADLIADQVDLFDAVNPDLTLMGLRIVQELNRGD